MATLYLRNVPDEVSERLALLAAREGLSVSAFAVRELREVARRVDNPAILDGLPDVGVRATDVVAGAESGRAAGDRGRPLTVLALLNDADARGCSLEKRSQCHT